MSEKIILNRNQLAQFLPTPQAIKAFEDLFYIATQQTPNLLDALSSAPAYQSPLELDKDLIPSIEKNTNNNDLINTINIDIYKDIYNLIDEIKQNNNINSEEIIKILDYFGHIPPIIKETIRQYPDTTIIVDDDQIAISDSATEFSMKKISWANIKLFLKTYFDTLYTSLSSSFFLGTTTIALNRASGAQSLTGISIDGSSGKTSNIIGGNNTTLLGSIPYQSNTDTTTLLPPNITTTKKFLTQTGNGTNGANPSWSAISAIDISGLSGSFSDLAYTGTLTGGTGVINIGSNQFYKNTAGNIGVGIIPNSWGGINKVLELGSTNQGQISIYGRTDGANDAGITLNAYRDNSNTWRYKYNGYACLYEIAAGAFYWGISPSGTAGNAITFTYAQTLDNSGNLIVPNTYSNTTASSSNMYVDSSGKYYRSTSSIKYKKNIEDIQKKYIDSFFENARPIYYKSLSKNDNQDWGYWGFIAEEIAKFDPRLVHWKYRDNKQVIIDDKIILQPDIESPLEEEGIMYERISVLNTAKIQELIKRVNLIESKLNSIIT